MNGTLEPHKSVATIRYPGGIMSLDADGIWHADRDLPARVANRVAGRDSVGPADGHPLVAQARKLQAILKGELSLVMPPEKPRESQDEVIY